MLRKIFLVILILAALHGRAFARDLDLSLSSGSFTYSPSSPVEGQRLRLYVQALSGASEDVYGTIQFFFEGTAMGSSQPISVIRGVSDAVFLDFTVPFAGYVDLRAEVRLFDADDRDVNPGNNVLRLDDVFVDYDTDGDSVGNTVDVDDDSDGILDSEDPSPTQAPSALAPSPPPSPSPSPQSGSAPNPSPSTAPSPSPNPQPPSADSSASDSSSPNPASSSSDNPSTQQNVQNSSGGGGSPTSDETASVPSLTSVGSSRGRIFPDLQGSSDADVAGIRDNNPLPALPGQVTGTPGVESRTDPGGVFPVSSTIASNLIRSPSSSIRPLNVGELVFGVRDIRIPSESEANISFDGDTFIIDDPSQFLHAQLFDESADSAAQEKRPRSGVWLAFPLLLLLTVITLESVRRGRKTPRAKGRPSSGSR